MAQTALVLGAGGITGVAWQLGVIIGRRERGDDLTKADLIVGTSAGAVTGALVAAGFDPAAAAALDAPVAPGDPPMQPDFVTGARAWQLLSAGPLESLATSTELRRQIGALARQANVGSEEDLLASFRRRLPFTEWPDRLVVTAVDVDSGEPVSWTAASGVPLVPAVAASCAVPCLFPPIAVDGRRYMDGGVRSRTNADLAVGCDRVVILAPRMPMALRGDFAAETARLGPDTTLIEPDEASQDAIGGSVFATDNWDAVLQAGVEQGLLSAAA
jgi:NTE family protein